MNEIWANRLIAGTKTWDNVPTSRKNNIKVILCASVKNGKITPEQYAEITGEEYAA